MQPGPSLRRAIDRCYEVFAAYPRPRVLHSSPYRDADEILKTLTSAPLRDLAGAQIGPYSFWALTTVGDVDDYKHILPRILEEAVHENVHVGTEPAIIVDKLRMGKWLDWPVAEQDAVRELFVSACMQAAESPAEETALDDWLCGAAALGRDMPRVLRLWEEATTLAPALQLARFLADNSDTLSSIERKRRSGWWDKVDDEPFALLVDWLASDAAFQLLLKALETLPADEKWRSEQAWGDVVHRAAQRGH